MGPQIDTKQKFEQKLLLVSRTENGSAYREVQMSVRKNQLRNIIIL